MARQYFMFNGESSLDYNLLVSRETKFDSPEKDIKKVSIPGRNGDLLFYTDRYKNTTVTYKVYIMPSNKDIKEQIRSIKSWLLKEDGYLRLEDTYTPDEYRSAEFAGPINFSVYLDTIGACTLQFDCRPERYLKQNTYDTEEDCREAGYTTPEQILFYKRLDIYRAAFPDGYEVDNPTDIVSKPRLIIKGYGEITFTDSKGRETKIKILQHDKSEIIIDSESMICYFEDFNMNGMVEMGNFPTFGTGKTTITYDSTITELHIYPRWWRT